VEIYGEAADAGALERAMSYRNFSALGLERILEHAHPTSSRSRPSSASAGPEVLGALDDIESGLASGLHPRFPSPTEIDSP